MAWRELWGEPYWDYSWTVTLAKRGASPSPVGWPAPWGGYMATRFAAPPVRTHGMGRAARHPLCTWGLGVEGDRGVVWVPFAPYWRLLRLEGLGTTSACAEVSSIPGACPGSGMCLVAQDRKHPGQSLKDGRAGETTIGTVLGTVLGTTRGTVFAWDHACDPLQHWVRWLLPPVGAGRQEPSCPTAQLVGAAESRRLPGAGLSRMKEDKSLALQCHADGLRQPGCLLSPPACNLPGRQQALAPSLPQVEGACGDAGKELTSLWSDRLINFSFFFETVKPMPVPGM